VTYSTKHDLINNLQKQFSRTLHKTDIKIRLTNNTPTSICVNNKKIEQINGMWYCESHAFQYKKSAVAYQICCENNDRLKAQQILLLDNNISKFNENIAVYHWHLRKTRNKVRKDILYCRISEDQYRLNNAMDQLTTNLNSIKIA